MGLQGSGGALGGNGGSSNGGPMLINGELVSPDDPRLSAQYYAYYYSQRPLDPRLPPPLFNWSSWHLANAINQGE